MAGHIFETIKTASAITDKILVFFSGGKDSVVTLDLCARHFRTVVPVFMYLVPGLSFQEAELRWAEQRYGQPIMRVPHFMLSEWLRYGTFRQPDLNVPMLKPLDVYTYCRKETGIWWIAAGERIADSIVRRAMIKSTGSIDPKRGRIYPVAYWRKPDVLGYVKAKRLKISPESSVLGFSFRSLMGEDMAKVKHLYPADYAKIRAWFPMVETGVKQHEYANEQKQAV